MWHRGVMAAFQPARELQKWSRKASGFPRVEGKVSPGVSGTYGPGREPAGGCGRGGPELYSRWLLAGSPMMVCERGVNGAPCAEHRAAETSTFVAPSVELFSQKRLF